LRPPPPPLPPSLFFHLFSPPVCRIAASEKGECVIGSPLFSPSPFPLLFLPISIAPLRRKKVLGGALKSPPLFFPPHFFEPFFIRGNKSSVRASSRSRVCPFFLSPFFLLPFSPSSVARKRARTIEFFPPPPPPVPFFQLKCLSESEVRIKKETAFLSFLYPFQSSIYVFPELRAVINCSTPFFFPPSLPPLLSILSLEEG